MSGLFLAIEGPTGAGKTTLAARLAEQRRAAARDRVAADGGAPGGGDWALLKQTVFAATILRPADVARLAATVMVWADSVPRPDLLIGLSALTAVIRQRVRLSGRDMEAGVTTAHLDQLVAAFDLAYAAWDRPLIRVNATTFNTFDDTHIHELAEQVRQLQHPLEIR